jgi:hypothetical protein
VSVELRGPSSILHSPAAVGAFAIECVSQTLLGAADLAEARGLSRPRLSLDAAHVEAAFTSERHARIGGRAPELFSAFSTWLLTADGWLRSHGNYPHHRAALLRALELDREDVGLARAAAAARKAEELEEAIFAAGGCAAALRDRATWDASPHGRALAGRGLMDVELGPPGARPLSLLRDGELPAAGVRVLDLTRVIAGPVATRMLAALGADVLRIDAPGSIELEASVIDGCVGKRSAYLDVGSEQFQGLLAQVDVLVHGYRPGALEARGLNTAEHPHLVTASLSAWGEDGPWGARRGFDSLVQSATGIAVECGNEQPGALPAQALDHGTGYLIAACVLRGLAERARSGRAAHARFALARTAAHLLDLPRGVTEGAPVDPAPFLAHFGDVTLVNPPGELDGRPLRWPHGPEPIGSSTAHTSWR